MPSPDGLISKGQRWAMKCSTGLNTVEVQMDYYQAKNLLDALNETEATYNTAVSYLLENGAHGTPKAFKKFVRGEKKSKGGRKVRKTVRSSAPKENIKDKANRELFERAHAAGIEAGDAATPVPMIVVEHENMLDDTSPIKKQYAPVMEGPCGFAWVQIRPGTSSFARWLVKTGKGSSDDYRGGVFYSPEGEIYGQGVTRKAAYCGAFARVLSQAGLTKTYARSMEN